MDDYGYLDDEFTENMDYCDVHGNPLVLFQADSGDKYVNIEDVRKAGFAIFRKDTFNPLLVDRKQIQKEFELHLLSESKNYILKNKAIAIDEEHILRTIERCKNKLLGEQPADMNQSTNQTSRNQSMSQASSNDTFVKPEKVGQMRGGLNSFDTSSPIAPQRPPKTLPSNFVPTTTQRNYKPYTGDKQWDQKPRQNNIRESNGFGDNTFESKGPSSNRSRTTNHSFGSESNRSRSKSRQRDEMSQSSDASERKRKYLDLENVDKINKIDLEIGSSYDVTISHVEKENICWAHKKETSVDLENLMIKLFDLAPELEDVRVPIKGQLALAIFEDVWCRARILNDSPLYIHFLDYGNRHKPESVKVFPEDLKKIPVLGLRFVLNRVDQPLATDTDMRIRIKQKYTDGTYVADVESILTDYVQPQKARANEPAKTVKPVKQEAFAAPSKVETQKPKPVEESRPAAVKKPVDVSTEKPKEPKVYFGVPNQLSKVNKGDKVMLLSVVGNKFGTKTKESAQKSKELLEYIKNLDKSGLLMPGVKEGQLVLCSKDGLPSLYRAVVEKCTKDVATVRYLDYPGEDQLSVKSLRNVDEFLSSYPTMMLFTPELGFLEKLGPMGSEYVEQLLDQKEKVTAVVSDDGDFDFLLDSGSLLSQTVLKMDKVEKETQVPKLVPVKTPVASPAKAVENVKADEPKPKPVAAAKKQVIVTYDDMDWIKLEVGSTDSYLCYTLKDLNDLTLISLNEESIGYMAKVTDLTVNDATPYQPSEFEMCLVAYQAPEDDEPQWYRGVVLEKGENGDYTVQAVDFGNQIVVKSKSIRKFDEELKDIPILGISCECVGIPENDAVLAKMKQLLPEGEEVVVSVKAFDDLKYQIELPQVYKTLKEDGLC